MKHNEPVEMKNQEKEESQSLLEQIIKEGARKLLQAAIENEVKEYITLFSEIKDENNRCMVVRNGFLPERSILTGIGPISIKQPRVRDKREEEIFTSAILPRYLRRIPSLDNLIPVLYLKGISTGDFTGALSAILGENAKGLSANTVVRLKKQWQEEYKVWIILSCYLLSTNDIITPEVYFFFRRSYEKTCTITDGFQRIFGAITEKGKNKDTISKGSVFMAACFPWAVVS